MDQVLSDGLSTALHFLEKSQEFFPFAVARTREGEIRHVNVGTESDRPKSDRVIDLLRASLRASAEQKEITCAAIFSDVKFTDVKTGKVSDAIRAEIDDADDASVTCYLPYRLAGSGVETDGVVGEQRIGGIFAGI
jgi:hypothetical protein